MVNKIKKETLVLLDIQAYRERNVPLPLSTKKWIEKFGIPNEKEVFEKQRSQFSNEIPERGEFCQDTLNELAEKIAKTYRQEKCFNNKVMRLIRYAHENKVPVSKIAKWVRVDKRRVQCRIYPTPERLEYEDLLKAGNNSNAMLNFVIRLRNKGFSKYKIWVTTDLTKRQIDQMLERIA